MKESTRGCILLGSTYGPAFGVKANRRHKYEFSIDEEESVAEISGGFKVCAEYQDSAAFLNVDTVILAGSSSFEVDEMEVFTIEQRESSGSDTDDDNDY